MQLTRYWRYFLAFAVLAAFAASIAAKLTYDSAANRRATAARTVKTCERKDWVVLTEGEPVLYCKTMAGRDGFAFRPFDEARDSWLIP